MCVWSEGKIKTSTSNVCCFKSDPEEGNTHCFLRHHCHMTASRVSWAGRLKCWMVGINVSNFCCGEVKKLSYVELCVGPIVYVINYEGGGSKL